MTGTLDIQNTNLQDVALGFGPWLAPVDLSAAGGNVFDPQVAVDAQGNAVAVWRRYNGTHFIVQAAARLADAAWQAPVDLSAAGQNAEDPQVTVDAQGNAIAVWNRSNGTNTIVQAAARPADRMWQAPVNLSAAGQHTFSPQVAIDARDNAVAAWRRSRTGYHQRAGPLAQLASIRTFNPRTSKSATTPSPGVLIGRVRGGQVPPDTHLALTAT